MTNTALVDAAPAQEVAQTAAPNTAAPSTAAPSTAAWTHRGKWLSQVRHRSSSSCVPYEIEDW